MEIRSYHTTGTATSLHWPALLRGSLIPAIAWSVIMLGVTLNDQPGVICLTPMAWLLCAVGGLHYGQHERLSRSAIPGGLLAGAIAGLIMALLVWIGVAYMLVGEIRADEIARAYAFAGGLSVITVIASSLLTALTAHLRHTQRRNGAQRPLTRAP